MPDTHTVTPAPPEIDLGHCRLTLLPDGLVVITCDEDTVYEEWQVKEMVEATGRLTGGKKAPVLVVAGKYSSVTREARDFIGKPEALAFSSREAYVIQSLSQRILANFYLRFYAPAVPTRLFTDRQKAENWLRHKKNTRSKTK